MQAVQLGRACRNTANIKVRQPIATLYVKGAALPQAVAEMISGELNAKSVHFVDRRTGLHHLQAEAPDAHPGPASYGKLLGKIGQKLLTLDGNEVVDAFERGETVSFDMEGTQVTLEKADVLTEPMQKPGFVAESEGDMTVVIDTNLTPELIEEGYVREVISKLQNMRKDAGLRSDRPHPRDLRGRGEAFSGAGKGRGGNQKGRAGHRLHPRQGRRTGEGMEHQRRKGHPGCKPVIRIFRQSETGKRGLPRLIFIGKDDKNDGTWNHSQQRRHCFRGNCRAFRGEISEAAAAGRAEQGLRWRIYP